jgi:hypothetical protein
MNSKSLPPKNLKLPTLTRNVELVVNPKTGELRQAGADGPGKFVVEFKALAERDLFTFAKGVLGYDLLNTSLHKPFCRWLQQVPPHGSRRKLALLPRGHLKTTITKALNLHILMQPDGNNIYFPDGLGNYKHSQGTSTRILLASKTSKLAQSTLSEIMQILETNPLLRSLWPHCVWDDARREARHWNAERIVLPRKINDKEATIETVGVGGGITGYHFNVHDFDDLIDIEDANSPTTMETAINWFRASRALMDNPNKSLEFLTGTRWAVHDLYEHIERNDPSVEIITRRVVEHGKPIFPEVFDLPTIERLQHEFTVMFPLLYMNSAADPELTDFDMDLVRSFRIEQGDIVFDETEQDAMLAEHFSEAGKRSAEAATKQARIVKPGREGNAYDVIAARTEHMEARRARAS